MTLPSGCDISARSTSAVGMPMSTAEMRARLSAQKIAQFVPSDLVVGHLVGT